MSDLDVRIVELGPLRVAAARAFGPSPEEVAWRALGQWAAANGLLGDLRSHRFFGFNNPSPSAGSTDHGYEQWLTVGPEARPGDGIEIKDFPGGRYAMARCRLKGIGEAWRQLYGWCEDNHYTHGRHQWLEECLTPELLLPEMSAAVLEAEFDLYLPLAE